MLADGAYIDTSALAKRYLNEPGSDEVDQFLREQRRRTISRLGVLELRCLLARRRRAGEISADYERDAASRTTFKALFCWSNPWWMARSFADAISSNVCATTRYAPSTPFIWRSRVRPAAGSWRPPIG